MPDAIKIPGHPDKVGYDAYGWGVSGPMEGDVKHSAEGWAKSLKSLVQDINRRASWHFSILTGGAIWQHYPINAFCWHSGDTDDDGAVRGNMELVGIEHEGLVGTPLTAEQTTATIAVTKFCAEHFERDNSYARYPVMPADGWTLAEHNQISNSYTACPSDRVDWDAVLAGLVEEDKVYKLFQTPDSKVWLVETTGGGHPVLRKQIPNQQAQDQLAGEYGNPKPAPDWIETVPNLSKLL